MAAARPIIATDIGDLGRMVGDTDCGILLSDATPENIASAIEQLASADVREELGENGRLAAKQTYNTKATEQLLVQIYQDLTGTTP